MRFIALSALVALTAACAPVENGGPNMPVEPDGGIGDGVSRPMLTSMALTELDRIVDFPKSCILMDQSSGDPLLMFIAWEHPDGDARGQIKIGDEFIPLEHRPASSGGILDGGSFVSNTVWVTIEQRGKKSRHRQKNSYFWPAVLKIDQDGSGSNLYEGHYECDASGVPT
ncbi:hypothetical protein [Parasphingorhabdus cellanae]|uniref:Lipoprotein n=1 Tax=Parasphingorhabdus cellanae TaxID=2806553 RepID=A0ABX7T8E8_9SPHN|nr:hypothetical protein [Parasphingorhabdus cellanae]QTD56412.1 hypothetical protein J4G78_02070 [Parasphingorhabdus cellanae]